MRHIEQKLHLVRTNIATGRLALIAQYAHRWRSERLLDTAPLLDILELDLCLLDAFYGLRWSTLDIFRQCVQEFLTRDYRLFSDVSQRIIDDLWSASTLKKADQHYPTDTASRDFVDQVLERLLFAAGTADDPGPTGFGTSMHERLSRLLAIDQGSPNDNHSSAIFLADIDTVFFERLGEVLAGPAGPAEAELKRWRMRALLLRAPSIEPLQVTADLVLGIFQLVDSMGRRIFSSRELAEAVLQVFQDPSQGVIALEALRVARLYTVESQSHRGEKYRWSPDLLDVTGPGPRLHLRGRPNLGMLPLARPRGQL